VTECGNESVKLFGKTELSKKTLALIIVIFDLISLTSLIIMYAIVTYFQKDFSHSYDLNTVESRDFTSLIKDLPDSFKQYPNKITLRQAIWQSMQKGMDLAEELGLIDLIDSKGPLDKTIIDINFGYMSNDRIENMKLIDDLCAETELMIIKDKEKS